MAEENKTKMTKENKTEVKKDSVAHEHTHQKEHEHQHVKPNENNQSQHKHEEVKESKEVKTTETKEVVKEKPRVKKDIAMVKAYGVHMSKRHGMYICSFIKGKKIDSAIEDLEQVILLKKAVPFKGEIPHRKGKMMSGRYPVDASKIFIPMLKNLKGNVLFNGMDITKTRISSAFSNFASRPQRRGGQKGKRAFITIEAKEIGK